MMPEASDSELRQWDREIVWHAFTPMAQYDPWIIDSAEGCQLIDRQGHRYLDGVSSLWCNVHGHRQPQLDQAIIDQLGKVAHVTSLGMSCSTTIRLAKRLTELAPTGLAHVFFSSDGSSAVEVALKMAFQFWRQCPHPEPRRNRYVAFEQAYHGDTLGSVSVGGVARFHEMFRPLLFEVVRVESPDLYRPPKQVDSATATAHYLSKLERALNEHRGQIAAIVIEPLLQAAAGMRVQPAGFLAGVARLARQHDVLLIADEVAVGFGRTGSLFACSQEQVTPDLLCLGKGLTAGYLPMSATLTSDRIWQAFLDTAEGPTRTFFHGHTYGGNPLAAAVALANLQLFDDDHTLEKLPAKIDRLREHLTRLATLPAVGDARQCGLMAGVELVQDRTTRQAFPPQLQVGQRVCRRMRDLGVWLRPLGDVIVIMPPLCIALDQLDSICRVAEQAIVEVTQAL